MSKNALQRAKEDLASSDMMMGPDSVARTKKAEDQLNADLSNIFSGERGERALEYLRSITMSYVVPPDASDAQLRHHEGKRDLFRIINTRVNEKRRFSDE